MELASLTHTRLYFLVLTLGIALCVVREALGDPIGVAVEEDQVAELSTKLDNINNKLDRLSDTVNAKLDILIGQKDTEDGDFDNTNNVPGTPTATVDVLSTGRTDQDELSTPSVNILSVRRTPIPNGSLFTVRFSTDQNVDSADVFARIYDNYQIPKDPDTLVEQSNDEWFTNFTVTRDAQLGSGPTVYIGTNDDYMIGLELDNIESTPAFQDTFNVPELRTDPALEAVYEPGQNFHVVVTFPYSNSSGVTRLFYPYLIGVNLQTNQYHHDFEREEEVQLFEEGTSEWLPDKIQQTFTVLTSEHPVSGLLEVVQHESIATGGSLVRMILVSKYIKVRPPNQSGYLPPGFLTFVDGPGSTVLENHGNALFNCRNVTSCTPTCEAVGDVISDLQLFKVLPGGSLQQVTSSHLPDIRDSLKTIYWHVANDGSLSEGDIITYECLAVDARHQNTVRKRVDVRILPGALQ